VALAEDVLGILDDLRNTDGALRRARIVGRLWSAVRKLPAAERKQLGSILAERYAPRLAERIAAGREIDSAELLGMIRTVGKVDADEIGEIMTLLQDPDGRRELLADVAESLQDDLAGADIQELLDDPDARDAAVAAAARELGDDLEVTDSGGVDSEAVASGRGADPETAAASGALPDASHGTRGATTPETVPEPVPQDGSSGEDARADVDGGAATEPAVPDATYDDSPVPGEPAGETPTSPGLEDGTAPVRPTGSEAPTLVPDTSALGPRLRSLDSPISRLRLLRNELVSVPSAGTAIDLATAFPDGWQRRRAVAAIVAQLTEGDIATASDVTATLDRAVDRMWIVRSLIGVWDLDHEAVTRLASATAVSPVLLRVAQRG